MSPTYVPQPNIIFSNQSGAAHARSATAGTPRLRSAPNLGPSSRVLTTGFDRGSVAAYAGAPWGQAVALLLRNRRLQRSVKLPGSLCGFLSSSPRCSSRAEEVSTLDEVRPKRGLVRGGGCDMSHPLTCLNYSDLIRRMGGNFTNARRKL